MKTSKKMLSLLLIAAMLVSVLCMGVYAADAPVIAGGVHAQFGDPDATPTAPESLMSLVQDTSNSALYHAVYTGSDSDSYYPDILSLCAYTSNNASDAVRLVSASSNIVFATYDANGEHTTSEITYATNQNLNEAGQLVSSSIYTVKLSGAGSVTVYNGNALAFTVRFETPKSNAVAGGTAPKFVNGYLPIGQYASGQAWGSIYSSLTNVAGNDANTDRTVTTDAPTKITSGYAAMGISLGSPGGYVQFEFDGDGIANNAKNKYGIDFVIYGNPFNGNPEAGSVKVSQDGTTWYELAGSRYYNSETKRNTTISYKMIPSSTYGTNKKADIYYAIGNVPTGTGTTGWTLYKSNVVWWPESAAEGYGRVSGVGETIDGTKTVSDVTYEQLSETANGHNCWLISYDGVTLVKDSDDTDDYLFGYADVRIVGNAKDGTACNPYASVPTSGSNSVPGGDGFDISWAVNSNGEPVNLTSIKYVRVYTSAALSASDLNIMPTPGIFGETSAEVCGMFVAQSETANVGTTGFATVAYSAGTSALEVKKPNVLRMQTITIPSGTDSMTLTVNSSADNFFVGDAKVVTNTTDTIATKTATKTVSRADGATQYVRVITQTGNKEASINVIKVVFQ